MPSPTASAVWVQQKGEEQVIYLRIEQQEKFPRTAQAKGTALEGPSDQQSRLHKESCSSEQFAVLSAWETHASHFLIMEELILTFVANST